VVRLNQGQPHDRGPHHWCRPDRTDASAYGAGDRTLVLIRPDGYIGVISDAGDVATVTSYLAALGGEAATGAKLGGAG
jgi:hypothetical protein